METTAIFAAVLCGLTLIISAAADLYARRIPNGITLPAIGIGLILTAFTDCKALWIALAAITVIFLAGMTGVMGGGDLKLIMAVTTLCGLLPALCSVGIASAVMIAVVAIRKPKETLSAVQDGLRYVMGKARMPEQGRRLPFAPYLLFGFSVWGILRLILS